MREALRMLAAEGLVDISSRKGARVADLTLESVSDVFRVRSTLEGLAAELAARQTASEDVVELTRLHDEMRREVVEGRAKGFFDLNNAFHSRIAVMTGNRYLASLQLTTAARSFRPLFMALSQLEHLLDSVRDHGLILDAIRKGDSIRARERMEMHILNAEREALRLLDSIASSARSDGEPQ
jgi:DNA-binding GntR family transcriptional regulator